MSHISSKLGITTPIAQKLFDFGQLGRKIVDKIAGRSRPDRPKISEDRSRGRLVAKGRAAGRDTNLAGMQRAAVAKRPRPQATSVSNPVPSPKAQQSLQTQAFAHRKAVLERHGAVLPPLQLSTPEPIGERPLPKTQSPKTPHQKLDEATLAVKSLRTALGELARREQQARSDVGLGLATAGKEEDLLGERNALGDKIKTLLDGVTAQMRDPEMGEEIQTAFASLRRQLVSAALFAEYPQILTSVTTPFAGMLPEQDLGSLPPMLRQNLTTLHREAGRFLASCNEFGCLRGGETGPRSPVAGLERLIGTLEFDGSNRRALTEPQQRVLDYLKDLKTAVDLRATALSTMQSVGRLQDWIEADKSRPNPGLSRLFREFSQYGTVFRDAASDAPADRLNALKVIDSLTSLFADRNVPALFRTEHPGVKDLLKALKIAHFEEMAIGTFLSGLPRNDDVVAGFLNDVDQLEDRAVLTGKPVTIADLEKIAPQTLRDGLAKLKTDVEKAVVLHEAYDDQFRRIERVLGHDKAGAYHGAVFLRMGVPRGAGETAQIGYPLRLADNLAKLGKENPEAAFMVAGLAHLEHQLAKLEKDVIGRKEYANIEIDRYDHERIMTLAGVTTENMRALGYSEAVATEFPARMLKLSRAGFRNVEELDRHIEALRSDADKVFSDRSVQSMLSSFKGDSAAAIGREMRLQAFTEASGLGGGVQPEGKRVDATLSHVSPTVVEGFKAIVSSLDLALRPDGELPTDLTVSHRLFEKVESDIETLLLARDQIDTRESEARQALAQASKPGQGLDIDVNPDRPAGLRSAKVVLRVLELDEEIRTLIRLGVPEARIAEVRQKRDQELDTLRGYDVATMRRPWRSKLAAAVSKRSAVPDLDTLRSLKAHAERIVFIREGAKAERGALDQRLAPLTELRHELAAVRRNLDPTAMGTAEQMIRAAVLAHWPGSNVTETVKSGRVVDDYEPILHRAAIEKTLKSWGLDVETFAPEISMTLNGTLGRHDLKAWAEERRPIDPETKLIAGPDTRSRGRKIADGFKAFRRETFSSQGFTDALGWLANKKQMDADFQREVLAEMTTLKDGDKYDLKAGTKLSVTTGKIPVEPSATAGIRAKFAGSKLAGLVIERGGDGWKVTGRSGFQGQAGVDLVADKKFGDAFSMGASVGVEGTFGYLGGYTETFPDTPSGRQAFVKLLTALVNGDRPSPEIFEEVSDAARHREFSRKGGVVGKGYLKAELTRSPFGSDGDMFEDHEVKGKKSGAGNKVGIGFTAGLELSAFLSGKGKTTKSFNKSVYETETELTGSIGANAQLYVKVPTGLGALCNKIATETHLQEHADDRFSEVSSKDKTGKGLYDVGSGTANEGLINWELASSLVRTKKTKLEFARANTEQGEERLTKSEIVQRTNLKLGADLATLGVGSKDLADRLANDTEFRRGYEGLKAFMGVNDSLQITYAVRPQILQTFNDTMRNADLVAEQSPFAAVMMRRKAAKLLDDLDNYEVSKVTIWSKDVQKDTVNRGNALLIKLDLIAEVGHEESQVVWKPPARKT